MAEDSPPATAYYKLNGTVILHDPTRPNEVDTLIYENTKERLRVTAKRFPVARDSPSTSSAVTKPQLSNNKKIKSYFNNTSSDKIGFSRRIVKCIGSMSGKYLITEPYTHTMEDVLSVHGARLWRLTRAGFVMEPFLQNILKGVIEGLAILAIHKINYELDLDCIKFNNEGVVDFANRSELNPKLGNVWDSKGGYKGDTLWKYLRSLMNCIILRTIGYEQLHPEVKEFNIMLFQNCQDDQSKVMAKHPALLTDWEKSRYIVHVNELFHTMASIKFYVDADFMDFKWDETIKIYKEYRKVYENSDSTYGKDPRGLVLYIRDCTQHHDTCKLGKNGLRSLGGFINSHFPRFMSYVFRSHVTAEHAKGEGMITRDDV